MHGSGHLADLVEGGPQFDGQQLRRIVGEGVTVGLAQGGGRRPRRGAGTGSGSGPSGDSGRRRDRLGKRRDTNAVQASR